MAQDLEYSDTTLEARRVQMQILRDMSIEEKLKATFALNELARDCTRAGIRMRHPDYTDEQVEFALRRIMWGDKLFREVYPGVEVEP